MKNQNKKIETITEDKYEVEAYEYCDYKKEICMNDCYVGGGSCLSDLD